MYGDIREMNLVRIWHKGSPLLSARFCIWGLTLLPTENLTVLSLLCKSQVRGQYRCRRCHARGRVLDLRL